MPARPSITAARTSRARPRAGWAASSRVVSVALALLLARRVRQADADRALALLAALGVLVAAAPVLSPQYLLWLAPLSALLAPRYPLQAVLLAARAS